MTINKDVNKISEQTQCKNRIVTLTENESTLISGGHFPSSWRDSMELKKSLSFQWLLYELGHEEAFS